MRKMSYIADFLGLCTLMIMVAILAILIPSNQINNALWLPIYLAWSAGALFLWHKFDAVKHRWGLICIGSIAGAILWYVVTRGISHLFFGTGEANLSKLFDIGIAIAISPGITFIAIAGYVRALINKKLTQSPQSH